MDQKLNFVVFVVAIVEFVHEVKYFNRNAKLPSIGKIKTEIENGEDVTGPNHGSISPVAARLVSHACCK